MSESVLLADDQPVDPDDELLVAYLDDELDDKTRKKVEQRLVAEVDFRLRLQALQTGWEWLDELPNESTNEKLVESTIELAVEDLVPGKKTKPSWLSLHWKKLAFVAVLLFGFLAGAGATMIQRQIALTRDLEELAIAEDHEAYKLGDNFAFYRQLAYNDRWQSMIGTMEKVGQREMAPPSVVAAIPLDQRDDAIAGLDTETREKLLGRWQAYSGYGEDSKQKLRQVAREVKKADDSEKLLRTMKAASVWLEDLSEELRDELQSEEEDVRKTAIDLAIDITLLELARDSGRLLSDETAGQIYLWLQVLLKQRIDADESFAAFVDRLTEMAIESGRDPAWVEWGFIRMMVDDMSSRGRGFGGGPRGGSGFGMPGFGGGPGRPPSGRSPGGRPPEGDDQGRSRDGGPGEAEPRDGGPRPGPPRVQRITDQEYTELREQILSQEAREDLLALTDLSDDLTGSDQDTHVIATLRTWAREAVRRNSPDL